MFNRNYVRRNITSISILLFLILFAIFQYIEPGFLYNNDGSLREFGLNNNKKTILPIWFLSLLLAILSYLFVLYYLAFPKLR